MVVACLIIPSIPTHELHCKHLVLMSPLACLATGSHPPLILPHVLEDQRLVSQSTALWEVLHVDKELTPPTKLLMP
jgi:hypothetical protein